MKESLWPFSVSIFGNNVGLHLSCVFALIAWALLTFWLVPFFIIFDLVLTIAFKRPFATLLYFFSYQFLYQMRGLEVHVNSKGSLVWIHLY